MQYSWLDLSFSRFCATYPHMQDWLGRLGFSNINGSLTIPAILDTFTEEHYDDIGLDKTQILTNIDAQINVTGTNCIGVQSLTIIGGQNKAGAAERVELTLVPGEITCIVGPTGSGKSRLLADIEWMAQGDTPTKRKILLNGEKPDPSLRFSLESKLVAQLSQNMNFVMDTSAGEFVRMHAESRMIDPTDLVPEIIRQANLLAGEKFSEQTPVTSLSGGQSRALMIADTAFLSASPVVLIDEIENAGIDRKKALQLLIRKEKIVLMATHDPILALMGKRRLVIQNGGIAKIIETSAEEKSNLVELEAMDAKIQLLRHRLRSGEQILVL